ncbi:dTDP-4-dehydrorhamnose reductase [Candidatus Peregrinibacteria bacterium]|nr:dTDP-4-dehydrorhamnose reductase [Candidatus Peregrinibacteria bacterium]
MTHIPIVLFGKDGMLGSALVEILKKKQELFAFSKKELDITDKKSVFRTIREIKPVYVINAAAYTKVDDCEKNKKQATDVNAQAVKHLALACKKYKSTLIHYSTDYVFNGLNPMGYKENELRDPINSYGISKAMGEEFIEKIHPQYCIIRTSWLFGRNGTNFVDTILHYSSKKSEISVVCDQKGCPTYTLDLARKTAIMLNGEYCGIFHITNSGSCTWSEFAEEIVKIKKVNTKIIHITSNELKRYAKRPQYSILKNTKTQPLRNWKEALKDYLKNE